MPIAQKYTIRELMDACEFYFETTGRRMTFEYSLIGGVNDSDRDAELLSALAARLGCHVNLIPVNPVKERQFVRSRRDRIRGFAAILQQNGVNATVRREMGTDIDGACGQLRRRVAREGGMPKESGS